MTDRPVLQAACKGDLNMASTPESGSFIAPAALLKHWQGHRRLTRKTIEAFPEEQLFSFSIGGMRPFGGLATEMLMMAVPMLEGTVSGTWSSGAPPAASSKAELLARWDAATPRINELFAKSPAAKFAEVITAFGQYTGVLHDLLLYVIDNEIHHRGQGFVYLRALGIEPPGFYDRD
jgi:uncharacterized damage-inducible protein DinB